MSERLVAAKVGTDRRTIQRIKAKCTINTRKCQTVPKYNESQQKRAKTNCRKVYRDSLHKQLIIDDETYVECDPEDISCQKFYNFIDKSQVPDKVRFKRKQNFAKRHFVWQAIDESGHVSEPYINLGTMNAECLCKRLLLFIKKYHSINNVLF